MHGTPPCAQVSVFLYLQRHKSCPTCFRQTFRYLRIAARFTSGEWMRSRQCGSCLAEISGIEGHALLASNGQPLSVVAEVSTPRVRAGERKKDPPKNVGPTAA